MTPGPVPPGGYAVPQGYPHGDPGARATCWGHYGRCHPRGPPCHKGPQNLCHPQVTQCHRGSQDLCHLLETPVPQGIPGLVPLHRDPTSWGSRGPVPPPENPVPWGPGGLSCPTGTLVPQRTPCPPHGNPSPTSLPCCLAEPWDPQCPPCPPVPPQAPCALGVPAAPWVPTRSGQRSAVPAGSPAARRGRSGCSRRFCPAAAGTSMGTGTRRSSAGSSTPA